MKKVLSLLLALCMLCGMTVLAFASNTQDKQTTPVIIVSGFGRAPLSLNAQSVFPPSKDAIIDAVKVCAFPLIRVLFDRNWERFSDTLCPAALSVFETCRCDENGDSVYDVDYPQYPLSAENYPEFYLSSQKDEMALVHAALDTFGAGNVYFFSYDWRLDPLDHAEGLREMVQYVKAQTGSDKVSLVGCSMGGTVVMSYLYLYGAQDIHLCLLNNSAFQGITMVGEMFCGEFTIDGDLFVDYLLQFVRIGDGLKRFVSAALKRSLTVKGVVRFANAMLDGTKERVCEEMMYPLFGQMPGMWAFVADREYAKAKDLALDSDKHAKLIERIDRYHYDVQCNAQTLLKQAIADGCIVEITANYGKITVPITKSMNVCDDYLIDTSLSAGGAVCTDNGTTLPTDYVQKVDCGHNHISPDRRIDASACMFPEYTWFVRDMGHLDYPYDSQGAAFLMWLISAENQPDVFTDSRYPQFMTYSVSYKTLSAMQ